MKSMINFLSLALGITLYTNPMEAPQKRILDQEANIELENASYSDEESGPLIKKKRESTIEEKVEKLKKKVISQEIFVFKVGTTIPNLTPLANRDYILMRTTTVKLNKHDLVPSRVLICKEKMESFLTDSIIIQRKEVNGERMNNYLKWFVDTDYRGKLTNYLK